MYEYPKQRQTLARSMFRAVVLKPGAAKLHDAFWWWHHSPSGHVIGRFFP